MITVMPGRPSGKGSSTFHPARESSPTEVLALEAGLAAAVTLLNELCTAVVEKAGGGHRRPVERHDPDWVPDLNVTEVSARLRLVP